MPIGSLHSGQIMLRSRRIRSRRPISSPASRMGNGRSDEYLSRPLQREGIKADYWPKLAVGEGPTEPALPRAGLTVDRSASGLELDLLVFFRRGRSAGAAENDRGRILSGRPRAESEERLPQWGKGHNELLSPIGNPTHLSDSRPAPPPLRSGLGPRYSAPRGRPTCQSRPLVAPDR